MFVALPTAEITRELFQQSRAASRPHAIQSLSTTCGAEIAALWRQGEDLADFLTRTGVLADSPEPS